MSNPYPSRRAVHHGGAPDSAKGHVPEVEAEDVGGSEPESAAVPEQRTRVAKRRGRRSRSWWGLGVALIGVVVTVALVGGGFIFSSLARPAVLTVEGPLDAITVSGRQGSTPVVTTTGPVDVASAKLRVEFRGAGREITEDSPVLVSVTAYDGETGENLNPGGAPNLRLGTANEDNLGALLSRILIGSYEGSRLVLARPLAEGGTEIDVVDVLYTIASGPPAADTSGPLTVSFSEMGPVVTHAAGNPPDGLIVQVLNEGTGPQVQSGDVVVAQYLAGNWGDGQIVASTWATGSPAMVSLEDAMPGIRDALVDQRVGSRLAVTIPAEMATGADTLFVVVDILGAMPASGTEATTDDLDGNTGE